jgi:hypothetical protein
MGVATPGRRSGKRRRDDDYEDVHVSSSPRTQRWYDRGSSPLAVYDDYYHRRESPGHEDRPRGDALAKLSPQRGHARQPGARVTGRKQEKIKKPIEVDGLGIPFGNMKDQFVKDISAFVKEMNPCVGFDKQKQKAKDRLHES